jgi:type III pantothenate kinase
MLLAIDIGNTLIDFGVFAGDDLLTVYKIATDPRKSLDEYGSVLTLFLASRKFDPAAFGGVAISSVVPHLTGVFASLAEDVFAQKPVVVGPHLKTGLRLKVAHPEEVGADLVCDAAGGLRLFGAGLFIADLGTANKYLYIDAEGAFAGLAIAPGLRISLSALVEKTAALPEISLVAPRKVIGTNTPDCMNSGLTYGTAFQIEGFAKAFEKEIGRPLRRILTGGNAFYVKDLLPNYGYEEFLTLKGLKEIYARVRP